MKRRDEQGLTLIELMMAVVVSSIFIGLVFSIYVRMSVAYRTEVVKSELQQVAQACPATMGNDIRQAGFSITRFRTATGAFGTTATDDLDPVMILNDADGWGPDSLRVFYGDPSALATVATIAPGRENVTVDNNSAFLVGDLVTLATPQTIDPGTGAPAFVEFRACVLRVTSIVGLQTVNFANDANGIPYNNAGNTHCEEIAAAIDGGNEARLLLFRARAYRIDPDIDRRALGVFQMSPSGELDAGDWIDMGIGFTDLQVASRYLEEGDAADLDADGDPQHDWYSADAQEAPAPASVRPDGSVLTQVSVSVSVRTHAEISGVGSSWTPAFIDDTSAVTTLYNDLGDSPAVDLTVAQASLPEQHRGRHIYRSSTQIIDVRNMGMGR